MANLASDARFLRRLAIKLEQINRSEDAISLLAIATDQTSQRLRKSMQKRLDWRLHGYNLDVLKPVDDYEPVPEDEFSITFIKRRLHHSRLFHTHAPYLQILA